jgi:hypothetical protein
VRDNSPVELVIILYLMFFGNVLPSHGRLVNTTPAMTSHTLLSRQIWLIFFIRCSSHVKPNKPELNGIRRTML